MCIAWPMQITEIMPDNHAMAELDGVARRISLRMLPEAEKGDFVLVHAGCAIEKMKPETAGEQRAIMQELKQSLSSL